MSLCYRIRKYLRMDPKFLEVFFTKHVKILSSLGDQLDQFDKNPSSCINILRFFYEWYITPLGMVFGAFFGNFLAIFVDFAEIIRFLRVAK